MEERGLILLYHRVAEVPTDPQLLCVSPAHFVEHLEVIRHTAAVVPLREMDDGRSAATDAGRLAITFDDGYADNLHQAKPILERFDAPATVFAVSGAVGSDREFWWDELDRLLLQRDAMPPGLRLKIGEEVVEWDLAAVAAGDDGNREQDRRWSVLERNGNPRQELYRSLCTMLRPLPSVSREKALDELAGWTGRVRTARPTHRALSAGELADLTAGGLIEVGAHTVTHPVLAALSTAQQQAELSECKAALEGLLARSVNSFSYPYGTRKDYTPATVRAVQQAGFTRACSNFAGVVGARTDPFQLPRMLVRDWGGEEFARRLREAWGRG